MRPQHQTTKSAPRATPAIATPAPPGTSAALQRAAGMPAPVDRDRAVRELAYSFFEARGRVYGHELEDWLKAEAEVEEAAREAAVGDNQSTPGAAARDKH